MGHAPILNTYVLNFLPEDLDNRVILDVGCGFGDWGFLIRTRKSGVLYLIGVDIWRPYLKKLCSLKVYDELIQVKLPRIPLKEKSVDISLACEILEHLPKRDGYELLRELERVTREMIVASVPLNLPQDEIHGNPFQKHISEWLPKDFARYGYEIEIVHRLPKTLRFVDKIRRFIFKLPPTPRFIVARKLQGGESALTERGCAG